MSSQNRKDSKEDDSLRRRVNLHFQYLYDSAIQQGFSPDDLSKIDAVMELREDIDSLEIPSCVWKSLVALFISFLAIVIVYLSEWPVKNDTIFRLWLETKGVEDPRTEKCAAELPELFQEMVRPPPQFCRFCQNVKSVEKVENITPENFEKRYAYTGRPVVVKDGTKNWTASEFFSFQFMKSIYTKNSTALENVEKKCQFFAYKSNFKSFEEVFEMSEERAFLKDKSAPWYIGWSNCDLSAANVLRQHYSRPYFLPKQAESSKTDWIFMGSPGYGASMHIDYVNNPSWQAQITGTKRWTLEPPPECYFACKQSFFDVTVQPGEIIVLDTNLWFHATLNVGDNISIAIGSEFD
ncbi:uncharacterized protein LOC134231353 [Saccostrea cucullata]|uniref:uncharacterized protein LOC134231353 n=1 Tax=Saccostrea cuccullata TaxID=36930 RepID=UPI002ED68E0E